VMTTVADHEDRRYSIVAHALPDPDVGEGPRGTARPSLRARLGMSQKGDEDEDERESVGEEGGTRNECRQHESGRARDEDRVLVLPPSSGGRH